MRENKKIKYPLARVSIRAYLWELGVLAVAALLYALFWPQSYLGILNDDAVYLLGARSLLHGRYAWLYFPGQPPQTHFLPGFSVFLMPFAALPTAYWGCLRAIPVVLTLLSGIGIACLGARWGLSRLERVAAMALFLFNPSTVFASSIVASEPCFIAFVLFAVLATDRLLDRPRPDWRVWLMGAFVGWISLVRPEGIALVAAYGTLALVPRWRRSALLIAAVASAIWLDWLMRNWRLTGHVGSYVQEWSGNRSAFVLSAHVWHQAQTLFVESAAGMIWGAGRWTAAAIVIVGVLLSARGWRRLWGANKSPSMPLFTVFIGIYLLIHAVWQQVDARYFLPLLPALFLMWLAAVKAPGRAWIRAAGLVGLLTLASVMIGHTGGWALSVWRRTLPAQYRLPRETLEWVDGHLPPSALVLTNKEGLVYLDTGRMISRLPITRNAQELYDRLSAGGVGYAVVFPNPAISDQSNWFWSRALDSFRANPREFRELYRNSSEGTDVYQILPR